jgi:hypothetical protein
MNPGSRKNIEYYKFLLALSLMYNIRIHIVTYQRITRQRLDKHPAICTRNNRTNVYSSLLDKS